MRLTILASVATLAGLVSMTDSGFKLTQIRNSLIASEGAPADFDWIPSHPPARFLGEHAPPPSDFLEAVDGVLDQLPEGADPLERALALAAHLGAARRQLGTGGIKSSTREAYRIITTEGLGYCADYTQVMNGLSYAAGIPVREWGMSFDDYSGNGHAFNEIYDESLSRWVLVDSYYSLYFVARDSGRPLSAVELQKRLSEGQDADQIDVRPIREAGFTFPDESAALEYYRRGADHFFMYFGNNVFSYDANPIVSLFTPVSRALEGTVGIVLGVRPGIRLLVTDKNHASIRRLFLRRNIFVGLALTFGVLLVALAVQLRGRRRAS